MSGIEDLINNVVDQDFSKAGPMFTDIIQDKVNNALEQEKINIAAQVYNGGNTVEIEEPIEPTDDEIEMSDDDLDDVTDEEIEAAIDELDDEPEDDDWGEEES